MELRNIITFLRLIGAGGIKISEEEDWVRTSCPLAPFTHVKGRDDNPSFGIIVNNKGESAYNCFTCGSGRLWDLLHRMQFTVGLPKRARHHFGSAEIFDEEQVLETSGYASSSGYHDPGEVSFLSNKKVKVPDEVLSIFPTLEDSPFVGHKKEVEDYFLFRGILPEMLWEYGIRHDPEKRSIIFPMTDTDGEVYRLHVKLVLEKTFWYITPELLGYSEDYEAWGRKDFWFGLQHFDPILPVLLVESETDLLRLRSLGVNNVLAACGGVNKWKVSRIPNYTIYLGFDSDKAGNQFTMKAISLFKNRRLFWLDWNLVEITYYTKKLRRPKLRPAKDGGDIETMDQYEFLLENKIPVGEMPLVPTNPGYSDVWRHETTRI